MSFWNIVGGIKSLLLSDNTPKEEEVKWINYESKFEQLLTLLRTKPANEKQTPKLIINLLSEINSLLEQKELLFEKEQLNFFKYRNSLLDISLLLLSEAKIVMNNIYYRPLINNNENKIENNNNEKKNEMTLWNFSLSDLNSFQRTVGYNII